MLKCGVTSHEDGMHAHSVRGREMTKVVEHSFPRACHCMPTANSGERSRFKLFTSAGVWEVHGIPSKGAGPKQTCLISCFPQKCLYQAWWLITVMSQNLRCGEEPKITCTVTLSVRLKHHVTSRFQWKALEWHGEAPPYSWLALC